MNFDAKPDWKTLLHHRLLLRYGFGGINEMVLLEVSAGGRLKFANVNGSFWYEQDDMKLVEDLGLKPSAPDMNPYFDEKSKSHQSMEQ